MREIAKYCGIYCHQNHKKWRELTPHIEVWLNSTIASTTTYEPMFGPRDLIFLKEYYQKYQKGKKNWKKS
jgi:hypothetical protein